MRAILNIGLNSKTLGEIHQEVARSLVRAHFGEPTTSIVIDSDTEPTLVTEVDHPNDVPIGHIVHRIAHALGQDCIATWLPGQSKGRLIGPNAKAWGEFNPDFFLCPDGSTLAQHLGIVNPIAA